MIFIPALVLCVAPVSGRMRPVVDPGTEVSEGEVVAHVEHAGRTSEVRAPASGRVGGVLAAARQAVSRGEGVVWLSR